MNTENLRKGQLYYVTKTEEAGKDNTETGKPVVIISADPEIMKKNGTLTVANITRRPRYDLHTHVAITSVGYKAVAILEQEITITPERLDQFIGVVTESELQEIDAALCRLKGIDMAKIVDCYEKELAEKEAEIERLKKALKEAESKEEKKGFLGIFHNKR